VGDSPHSGRPHSHRARHGRPGGGPRAGFTILAKVLASAVSVLLVLGFGYGWYEYRSLDKGVQRLHLTNLAQESTPPPTQQPSAHHVEGVEQNILIVGMDSRSGLSAAERKLLSVGNADSLSTDTIMVIHVPADGSRASMISIPRDSYVDIPGGYLKNKINAAYADAYSDSTGSVKEREAAGANQLIATVKELTGLSINHYVQVGFGGFYTIAKAIGKIPVNLCHATDDTLAHNEATGQGRVGSNFKMSAGKHELTPVQVVEFVRQRHNLTGGDLAREKRQRYFLTEAFNKIESAGTLLNPVKLNHLIKAIAGTFYIDDNDGFSIPDLAAQMSDLSANKIVGYTIPTEGPGWATVAGSSVSVELVDPAKVKARIKKIIDGTAGKSKASGASKASMSSKTSTSSPATSTSGKSKKAAACID
jgi:LCP family protein required for cell wall assembly